MLWPGCCDDLVVTSPDAPRRTPISPLAVGYVAVITAAVLFGVNGGVSRIPLRSGTTTEEFTTVRITAALAVLVLVAAVVDRRALQLPRGRSLGLIVGLGVVGVLGVQATYNIAINRLPLGVALLIEYLGPVLVVLWVRVVRREPVHPRMWPALALALIGLAIVARIWTGLAFDGLGIAMALAAAVCFASYFLLGERNVGAATPLQVIIWSFAVAAVLTNLVTPVWSADDFGVSASALGRFADISLPAWAAMSWVVLLGTVVPFFLLLIGLRVLPATVVSIVAMLEPVVAALVGRVWFLEPLTGLQILGTALVLTGVVVAQTARRATQDREPA